MFSMPDFFKLLPESLKQTAVDTLVDDVIEQDEGLPDQTLSGSLKGY